MRYLEKGELGFIEMEDIAPALHYFQKETEAKHAFQVVIDLPWIDRDCFEEKRAVIIPARTFLSQLI